MVDSSPYSHKGPPLYLPGIEEVEGKGREGKHLPDAVFLPEEQYLHKRGINSFWEIFFVCFLGSHFSKIQLSSIHWSLSAKSSVETSIVKILTKKAVTVFCLVFCEYKHIQYTDTYIFVHKHTQRHQSFSYIYIHTHTHRNTHICYFSLYIHIYMDFWLSERPGAGLPLRFVKNTSQIIA